VAARRRLGFRVLEFALASRSPTPGEIDDYQHEVDDDKEVANGHVKR